MICSNYNNGYKIYLKIFSKKPSYCMIITISSKEVVSDLTYYNDTQINFK